MTSTQVWEKLEGIEYQDLGEGVEKRPAKFVSYVHVHVLLILPNSVEARGRMLVIWFGEVWK